MELIKCGNSCTCVNPLYQRESFKIAWFKCVRIIAILSLQGRMNRKPINILTKTDCGRPNGLGKPTKNSDCENSFVVISAIHHTFCPWQCSDGDIDQKKPNSIEKETTYMGNHTVLQRSHRIMEFGYLRGPPNPEPPAIRCFLRSSECVFP